jgi:hypothetical protein
MRCHRLIQKLANAAERSIAQQALDQNYIGLLKAANNEAKTRRNTKSDILKKPGKNGEGRVMRQEDLETIRADRAERSKQDAAKKVAGKAKRGRPKAMTQVDGDEEGKKRGRKRKSVAAEEGDPNEQVDASGPSAKAARVSEALIDPMPGNVESTCGTDVVMIDRYIDDGQHILDMNRKHLVVMRRIMSSVYFGLHKCHGTTTRSPCLYAARLAVAALQS